MFKHLSTLERSCGEEVCRDIMYRLSLLISELIHYFSDITCCSYVTDPYSVDPADPPLGTGEQEELIDIQADQPAKRLFENSFPVNFWLKMVSSYPATSSYPSQLRYSLASNFFFHMGVRARFLGYGNH